MAHTVSGHELLEPVAKIAERLTGNRPSPATLFRHVRKGCRGGRLNAVMHGGRWLTTESDYRRFMAEQTAAALGEFARSDEHLDQRLSDEGLL